MLKEIPFGSFYFHATFVDNLPGIKKHGILPNPPKHNYEDSQDYVYLSNKAEPAYNYMNNAWHPDNKAFKSGIVMLATRVKNISFRDTAGDGNAADGYSFVYNKVIPASQLYMCQLVDGKIMIDTTSLAHEKDIYLFDKASEKDELTRMFDSGLPMTDCLEYLANVVHKKNTLA